jgi:D-glycero-alpha-D-manno-heptose 1-phosphate guanylyltransferase
MFESDTASAGSRGPQADVVAVVLAGGFGTRIGHLLGDVPKPMMPVAGRPFLEWVARYFLRQGVRHCVFSTGYRSEAIERHFAEHPVKGCLITCVREETPLGTAGGFLNAFSRSKIDEAFCLVANGDSLALAGVAGLVATLRSGPEAALLGIEVADASRFGTLLAGPEGKLASFSEKRPGEGLINAGVYALSRRCIGRLPKKRPLSFETDCFPALLAEGCDIRVVPSKAPFLDIGTEESLRQADRFIEEHANWF